MRLLFIESNCKNVVFLGIFRLFLAFFKIIFRVTEGKNAVLTKFGLTLAATRKTLHSCFEKL